MMKIDFPKHKESEVFYRLAGRPVYMATVTKSGCTFLKNLFYYIDQGAPHPLGDRIHADESKLLRAGLDDIRAIENSPFVYMVIRNPIDRFYSLYYDKIVNPIDTGMYWFRDRIGFDLGIDFNPEINLAGHQRNTERLVDFLELNIARKTNFDVNYHWRPQRYRFRRIRDFDPILIALDELDELLPLLLVNQVPNIHEAMQAVRARNASYKPYSFAQTQTPYVIEKLQQIYKGDFDLYRRAKSTARARIADVAAQKG